MIWLNPSVSQEFDRAYKLFPESKRTIDQLLSGPCVALEIRHRNAVEQFKRLCGPYDPQIARKIEPNTLRARYGEDRVYNVVYCTDLPEDGSLEVSFTFENLLS